MENGPAVSFPHPVLESECFPFEPVDLIVKTKT